MDPDRQQALRLLMGGRGSSSDGGWATGLVLGNRDMSRFPLEAEVNLPPRPVSESVRRIGAAFAHEGFDLTSESLPGRPDPRGWSRRPAAVGFLVAERKVSPDPSYDRTTRWSSLILAGLWLGVVVSTIALDRGAWIEAVISGAFFLGLPAYLVSSYRGRGYSGLVAVAELSTLPPMVAVETGTDPNVALRVRLGAGFVRSHQSVGRGLGQRRPRSVESPAEARAAAWAIHERLLLADDAVGPAPVGRPGPG